MIKPKPEQEQFINKVNDQAVSQENLHRCVYPSFMNMLMPLSNGPRGDLRDNVQWDKPPVADESVVSKPKKKRAYKFKNPEK